MYSLFEPAQMGPLQMKNRTVRSGTNEHLSDRNGNLTDAWADAVIELARGGVGLIVTGYMTVDRRQRSDEGHPVIDEQSDRSVLERVAAEVHRQNAKIVLQISHSGPKAMEAVNGCPPKGPEDFSEEELSELTRRFVRAASIAKQAGFDGVQIHASHGYLLSSFINQKANRRTDAYGGTLENRFRLIREIIAAIRRECGEHFAILAKTDSDTTEDFSALSRLYQAAGIDALEISGSDFNMRKGEKRAFYLPRALEVRDTVSIPLILVGGIFSREEAERILDAGIPFVAFSRALICQPDFIARMERGEASACLQCNSCYSIYRKRPVRCVRHSAEIPQLKENFQIKTQEML